MNAGVAWMLVALCCLIGGCKKRSPVIEESPSQSIEQSVRAKVTEAIRKIPAKLRETDAVRYGSEVDAAVETAVRDLSPDKFKGLLSELKSEDTPGSDILACVVAHLIQRRERAELVALLSENPPYSVERAEPLEFRLATLHAVPPPWLERPLLILTEAYVLARKPTAKARLLKMLGDSFPSIRADHKTDDAAFVDAVTAWYTANMEQLRLNPKYGYIDGAAVFLQLEAR
jgi:hypothetical protein